MFSILNRALSWAITSFGNEFCLKKRSRLIKALDNRFYVKFMQLEIGLLSSSSFHMFIYARSEQCDLVPIYTITNTQRIRIYPGKLKFILVKISSDAGQRKPNSIHVSYYREFIRTPLFTRVQIRSVSSYAVNLRG